MEARITTGNLPCWVTNGEMKTREANIQLVRAENSGCTLGYEVVEREKGRRCLTPDFWERLEQSPRLRSLAQWVTLLREGKQGSVEAHTGLPTKKATRSYGKPIWVKPLS